VFYIFKRISQGIGQRLRPIEKYHLTLTEEYFKRTKFIYRSDE